MADTHIEPGTQRRFHHIVYWYETARGGHFAAFEQPALFINELCAGS